MVQYKNKVQFARSWSDEVTLQGWLGKEKTNIGKAISDSH